MRQYDEYELTVEDFASEVRDEILRNYYYFNWLAERAISKSWEELNRWEVAQVERDFEEFEQEEERRLDPEKYYCTAGTR